MATLMTPKDNLLNAESEKMMMSLIQNSLLALMLLTEPQYDEEGRKIAESVDISPETYNDAIVHINNTEHLKTLPDRLNKYGVKPLTGKALFSSILPQNFYFEHGNVRVVDGILTKGTVDASAINTLLRQMVQDSEFGGQRTLNFMNDVAFVVDFWLSSYNVSFSLEDLMLDMPGLQDEKENFIALAREQAFDLGRSDNPYDIKRDEDKMRNIVENIKSKIYTYIKDRIPKDNVMSKYTRAGVGKMTPNVPQIIGMLGQQFISGRRLQPAITGKTRCLPTFDPGDFGLEARGCILDSYSSGSGLRMSNMFFAQQAGREALTNMANNTQVTGDIHNNKLTKGLEGVIYHHDGTVRNNKQHIIQYSYGIDGTNSAYLSKIKLANKEGDSGNEQGEITFFTNMRSMMKNISRQYGYDPDNDYKYDANLVGIEMVQYIGANYALEDPDRETLNQEVKPQLKRIPISYKSTDETSEYPDVDVDAMSNSYREFYQRQKDVVNSPFVEFYNSNREKAKKRVAGRERIPKRKVKGLDIHMELMDIWHQASFNLVHFIEFSDRLDTDLTTEVKQRFKQEWSTLKYLMLSYIEEMKKYLPGDKFERFKFDSVTRDVFTQLSVKEPIKNTLYDEYSAKLWIEQMKDKPSNKKITELIKKYDNEKKEGDPQLKKIESNVQNKLDELWDALEK